MFPHRKPCLEARKAMSAAALKLGSEACCASRHEETRKAIRAISEVTKHRHVKLVSSGNAAILAVLKGINGRVMIPDQGGWKGFKSYPRLLGLEVCEVETNLGLIEPEVLGRAMEKHKPKALLITSFAGYMAEQDVREISRVCKENEVLLIEDASGAIGDYKLADGSYADVIVCSTGAPKILNVLNGGFISTNNPEILGNAADVIKACRVSPVTCAGIVEELKNAGRTIKALTRAAQLLKNELRGIVHNDKRGICVGIELSGDAKKFAVKAREKGLKTEFGAALLTPCPAYERFLKNGAAIELKKLDILEMSEEKILEIAKILKSMDINK
ncbi:MAG: DegT/DnrJ/EryC1/StrS family aminotransferase [Euryarchaeota archaeon]|nr:DegT/DnrJ/EryC1/StrS family aminotransferase [Euryarchaeota archaeon]